MENPSINQAGFEDDFEEWFDIVKDYGRTHGEHVADEDAWREPYDRGLSPEDAFFEEFPERRE